MKRLFADFMAAWARRRETVRNRQLTSEEMRQFGNLEFVLLLVAFVGIALLYSLRGSWPLFYAGLVGMLAVLFGRIFGGRDGVLAAGVVGTLLCLVAFFVVVFLESP